MGKQARNNTKLQKRENESKLRKLFGNGFRKVVTTKDVDAISAVTGALNVKPNISDEKIQRKTIFSRHHTSHSNSGSRD
jgi:hypothetical protein